MRAGAALVVRSWIVGEISQSIGFMYISFTFDNKIYCLVLYFHCKKFKKFLRVFIVSPYVEDPKRVSH